MTRSGRADVTRTSGGMVSPLSDLPGKSLIMLALFVRPLIYIYINFRKKTIFRHTFYLCEYNQMATSEVPCNTVSRPDITRCRE